jgi:hypothetical protein
MIRHKTVEALGGYATARGTDEPISTAITESTVPWAVAQLDGRQPTDTLVTPGGAHLMLKDRTSLVNWTVDGNFATEERWARRLFRKAA